jgi:hydrogenase-4 component F
MIVQRDLKRLLAYSSIEHMGIVALGVGIGGPLGLFGALLHAFNHSLAKTLLFFTTGKVRDTFDTLRMDRIHGMARVLPYTSSVLIAGGVAIVGLPPFGLFVSEFSILMAAFGGSHYIIAAFMLIAFSIGFGALLFHFQRMLGGEPQLPRSHVKLLPTEIVGMCTCGACLLSLGVHIPGVLISVLNSAVAVLQ